MNVGVRALRDELSRHLAEVKDGHTITVTEHGRPIARIVPMEGMSTLERLIAEGVVTPPSQPKTARPKPVAISGTVSDLVAEQRG